MAKPGFIRTVRDGLTWPIQSDLRELQKSADRIERAVYKVLHESVMRRRDSIGDDSLARFGYSVFSQGDEDGILEEIFARIGSPNRCFVEFGAEDGRENNGRYLLLKGWQGFWLESDPAQVALLGKRFRRSLDRGALLVTQAVVTRENVEALLTEMGVPVELDLLSIDIDGNDYWVWKAMSQFRPRVVVIEYNAALGPRATWVMPYDADHAWDGRSSRFGASLKALERLGTKKGYDLVGCSFTGVNAFFVRSDLIGGRFTGPFTAERHYEPARYFPVSWAYSPDWGNNEDWAANGSEAGLGDTQARPSE